MTVRFLELIPEAVGHTAVTARHELGAQDDEMKSLLAHLTKR